MGQAAFHLPNKVLECIECLLCLSKIPLRQKSVLQPSEVNDRHSSCLQCAYREGRQRLHHTRAGYGIH